MFGTSKKAIKAILKKQKQKKEKNGFQKKVKTTNMEFYITFLKMEQYN